MTPLESRRLVGQPDIVERLTAHADAERACAEGSITAALIEEEAAAEIERLRCALRAVRACTDPAWQLQIIADALRETKP